MTVIFLGVRKTGLLLARAGAADGRAKMPLAGGDWTCKLMSTRRLKAAPKSSIPARSTEQI